MAGADPLLHPVSICAGSCAIICMQVLLMPIQHRPHVPDGRRIRLSPDPVQQAASCRYRISPRDRCCSMPLPAAALYNDTPRSLQLRKMLLIHAPQLLVYRCLRQKQQKQLNLTDVYSLLLMLKNYLACALLLNACRAAHAAHVIQ